MYSFVQESIQGKISKSTPTKATLVKKRLLETVDPEVGFSPLTKTNNGRSSQKTLEFGRESIQTYERGNSNSLDKSQ